MGPTVMSNATECTPCAAGAEVINSLLSFSLSLSPKQGVGACPPSPVPRPFAVFARIDAWLPPLPHLSPSPASLAEAPHSLKYPHSQSEGARTGRAGVRKRSAEASEAILNTRTHRPKQAAAPHSCSRQTAPSCRPPAPRRASCRNACRFVHCEEPFPLLARFGWDGGLRPHAWTEDMPSSCCVFLCGRVFVLFLVCLRCACRRRLLRLPFAPRVSPVPL